MKRIAGIFASLAVVILAGCGGDGLSAQGKSALESGLGCYNKGDNAGTITHANSVLQGDSKGFGLMQARYLRGLGYFRQNKFKQAKADFELVDATTINISLRIKALDALGEIAYVEGEFDRAEKYFEQVLSLCPAGAKPLDHTRYRLGCILQRKGKWEAADRHFYRVRYAFSDSELAKLATVRAGARAWTIQLGSYIDGKNARAEARRLIDRQVTAFASPTYRQGKLVYLLQLGRWDDYSQAVAMLPKVQKIKGDAFIQVTR